MGEWECIPSILDESISDGETAESDSSNTRPQGQGWTPATPIQGEYSTLLNSYVQTVPNHRRLLIINDKSLPYKQRRGFTWLLIFQIKFSSYRSLPLDD